MFIYIFVYSVYAMIFISCSVGFYTAMKDDHKYKKR